MRGLRSARVLVCAVAVGVAGCGGGGAPRSSSPTSTTVSAAPVPGHIITWTLTSRFVDPATVKMAEPPAGVAARPNALRVNVYLPAGYDGVRRFPVLYLLHGASSAYDYWAAPERGDLLNTVKGFAGIIVMPEAGDNGWYANWWNGGQRANPAWESFYLDELIPYVEQHLAVLPGRQNHAIAGVSMGGQGAIYLASQLPGYFGTAASFSGAVDIESPEWQTAVEGSGDQPLTTIFGDLSAQHFYWVGHNPTRLVANLMNTRVYVTVGDGKPQTQADRTKTIETVGEAVIRPQSLHFSSAARAAHVPVTLVLHGGIHDWPYFRHDLADAIHWNLFASVSPAPTTWTYQTVSQHGDAYGYKFAFQQPPDAIETFSLDNGTLTGTGSGHVTVTTPTGQNLTLTMPFTH